VTCVLGRNGVGKTSLLRAILGQVPVRRGRIDWEGRQIESDPAHRRARAGIGNVPQGREIFPRLTVEETLRTAFAAVPRGERTVPEHVVELFPVLREMLRRRGGDLSGRQQQQLTIARALVTPTPPAAARRAHRRHPALDHQADRGVIRRLAAQGDMAILLVEQYLDFAREIADDFLIMGRGEVVMTGAPGQLDEAAVRRYLTV
jgi:urea transport system ATP-binding protein